MIIDEFRVIWQRSRQDRWQECCDASHGAYLRLWLAHHGDYVDGDTIGGRVERYLRSVRRAPWSVLRANGDLCTFYDRVLGRFGPVVAAEALRRLLLGMAHRPMPRKTDRDAEATVDKNDP
ncbi:MAG: hypothetical protein AB7T59_16415 [Hyphomonadaceae bacterium]